MNDFINQKDWGKRLTLFFKAVESKNAELIAEMMQWAIKENEEAAKIMSMYLVIYQGMCEQGK